LGDQPANLLKRINRFHSTAAGQDFADVVLTLDTIDFPAHRAVLAARSSYFEGMFRYQFLKQNSVPELGKPELSLFALDAKNVSVTKRCRSLLLVRGFKSRLLNRTMVVSLKTIFYFCIYDSILSQNCTAQKASKDPIQY
jgi:hypothetical protein